MDPNTALRRVRRAVEEARNGAAQPETVLEALTELRELRDELAGWEPELITAARAQGASWAVLAPALGVASRQAAERRYLRLQPSESGETTGEARVSARRDQRAGDRAVARWARENSATLRRLAGRISADPDLPAHAADELNRALGESDAANLVGPLASSGGQLPEGRLAEDIAAVNAEAGLVRETAIRDRH
ncbi:HSP18 transcriptional regulator [Amycolatopsis acidicola]|uniref:HSP18 transcriptional regulator n=1 Tax=Amycolatopsis acidicola TaxID=2596893 RepID=A0A5N0UTN0_9PSEU|nr:HSP18 transcriptional regulator [Amycolatopsis acidicola]KAA9155295.1 HSP18 transcriptional regulator [Amycolatopsis acidicola]